MTPEERAARRQARLDILITSERDAMARCELSGAVEGFRWPLGAKPTARRPRAYAHRVPPLPFHSHVHKGAGTCRVCGQPIWRDLDCTVPDKRTWHPECVSAFLLWTKPGDYAEILVHRQGGVCPISGQDIRTRAVEVDHEVPLFRVAIEHAGEPWWRLLRFWGLGNLRALSQAGHKLKSAQEARWRAGNRPLSQQQPALNLS